MNNLLKVICLFFISTPAFGQKIPFGKNSFIEYKTDKGTFDVYVNGKAVLKDGYSEVLVNKENISSRDFIRRTLVKSNFEDESGTGQQYKFSTKSKSGITLIQSILAYNNRDFFVIRVSVSGSALSSNQMFPLRGKLTAADDFTSQTSLTVPFDNDAFISYQANLLMMDKEYISSEITSVYDNHTRKGYVFGTLNHDKWKTGLKTSLSDQRTLKLEVVCGYTGYDLTRDRLEHGYLKGATIASSNILFGYFDDWRKGMETYGKTVRVTEKPIVANWTGKTPVGWNSWGAMQEKLSYEKVTKVVDFFAENLKSFRMGNVAYIDLDSYWDNLLKGNDYSELKRFAAYCKSKGLRPGIYWAPFTDWGFKDGANRKAPGSDFTFGEMWTKVDNDFHDFDGARALDPTHPGTQKRIRWVISNLKDCGFEMIKIDFLGHAAIESTQFYDAKITTGMQAYRVGMEYLLQCLDNKMLIYAAISPSLASGRYVQVRRIACDAFKSIKDTEYTLNSVTNGWWQTYLYNYIDADHVVLGKEDEAENVSRTLSAIVTGTLVVGDDFSVEGPWKEKAVKFFQNHDLLKIISDGKAFRPVEGNKGKGASNQFVKEQGKVRYVALFNYENIPTIASIDYSRLGFDGKSIVSIENLIDHGFIAPENYFQQELLPAQATMLKITLK